MGQVLNISPRPTTVQKCEIWLEFSPGKIKLHLDQFLKSWKNDEKPSSQVQPMFQSSV